LLELITYAVTRKEDSTLRKAIVLTAILAALCCPETGICSGDVLTVGTQFSATDPHSPSELTDVAGAGLHFRAFYEVVNLSKRWRLVGEFGYNTFSLREEEYENLIRPALEDSITASLPFLGFPVGSVATIEELSISGGDFNAMHFTAGAKYMLLDDDQSSVQPYVTAQAGLYSAGQSDSDLSSSFSVQIPGMADTTLSIPSAPWTRDVDRDNAFGFSIGGGTELSLMGDFAVVADLRYHFAFTEETTRFLDIGVGVAYYLGF
jgi:hypothetical protein